MLGLRRDRILLIDFLMRISFGLANFSYPAISRLVADQFGLSNTETGLVNSAFFAAYAVMQIPGGFIVEKIGSPRSLFSSSLLMSLGPIIFIAGGSYESALISRVVSGAAAGVLFPSMIRLLSLWYERGELNKPTAIFATAGGISQIMAAWLLPLFIVGSSWRPPLIFTVIFSTAVSLIGIFPVLWKRNTSLPTSENLSRRKVDLRGLFTRNMFALMLPNFAVLVVVYGVFAWTSDYLVTTLHLSLEQAGLLLSSIGFASIVGSLAGGFLDHAIGKKRTILVSAILSVLFTCLIGFANSWSLAAAFIFGVGFSSTLYFAAVFSLIPFAAKQGLAVAGITFGVFNSLSNVGTFISPLIFGFVLDRTNSFTLGYLVLGAIASLGIIGPLILKMDQFLASNRTVVVPSETE